MWKDVNGYEGRYQVNEHGEVRTLLKWDGRKLIPRDVPVLLKQSLTTTGYWKVGLSKDGKQKNHKVHRLVAFAFIPTVDGKPYINHKDGNPLNNEVDNLEWCTQGENVIHAVKTGLKHVHTISKDELIRYVDDGLTAHQIEKITHVCYPRLQEYYRVYGVRNQCNKYRIDKDELKRGLAEGKTNQELSEIFKCPSNLIARRRYQMKRGEY